jgi:hypothetical protein
MERGRRKVFRLDTGSRRHAREVLEVWMQDAAALAVNCACTAVDRQSEGGMLCWLGAQPAAASR